METNENFEDKELKINYIGYKLFVIIVLGAILLGATFMLKGLISEREHRGNQAVAEVEQKWGKQQIVAGPVLTVPYKIFGRDGEGKVVEQIAYINFLPDNLKISGNIESQTLQRGIYDIIAYDSDLKFEGNFKDLDLKKIESPKNIVWEEASLFIGISDLRGINKEVAINWNEKDLKTKPGASKGLNVNNYKANYDGSLSGVNTEVSLNPYDNFDFSFDISIKGSKELRFIPLGNNTKVDLVSNWQTPSFDGAFLPDNRELNEDGFNANWEILQLNRNIPQTWLNTESNNFLGSAFGVRLLLPVDQYQKNMRSIKYAGIFIALTFAIFFFVEIFNKLKIHPIQYLLVGLALVLFFTLLLSLSEHIGFNYSYLSASIATILLITSYSKSVFKSNKLVALECIILTMAYSFIFTILQLQDLSLLVGSIGLFIILAIIMFVSRKIDWYGLDVE